MAKKGTGETNNSEENEEKEHILPKWLRILLMFIPALVYFGIILLVDYTIGFPEPINPIAITALTGAGLFGLLVIGDMLYRNIFVYRMLAQEAQKSREQKEQLKDKQIEKEVAKKFEFIEEEGAKGGEKEYENEYEYVTEDDEDYYYYKEPSEVEKETAKQKETPEEPKTTLASKPIKSYLL
ncbi:MAG: hypothetical protein U9O65_03040, partial [Thermotogota bacterium]|nr:hypothetical protein [Thermotogota bacterium]